MNLSIHIDVKRNINMSKHMNECLTINININVILNMIMTHEYVCEQMRGQRNTGEKKSTNFSTLEVVLGRTPQVQ